ncbi:MAG: UbiD family decarboxylase [Phycisphaerales bacterium]|nr:UbiD family decarboxylase [Phycisphaerales bacterium]
MYTTLREFVEALEGAGELARVRARVSPVLEISAAADLESRRPAARLPSQSARRVDPHFHRLGGRALLFEDVEGSEIPVLINSLGSYRRMEMALGCEAGGFGEIAGRIAELVRPQPPRSLSEAVGKLRQFAPLLRTPPRRVRSGLCQEVVRAGGDVDLRTLPLIRCWPDDGDFAALGYPAGINDGVPGVERGEEWERVYRGRYVTFAGIHTIHADDAGAERPASHNIGMYRVQLLGRRHMAMHWQMHHDGAKHWRSWKKRGERMPVAIAFGGESVLPYAATCPLPPGISELLMAGFLNGRGIPMVRAKTVPLWVPANAEIVIEGYVSTEAGACGWDPLGRDGETERLRDGVGESGLGPGAVFEGPFGDHTGFYSLPDRYGVLEVTAVTHRRGPILPATVVGLPPQEDYFIGKATERIMLPLLRTILPDIADYDLPMFGAFHNAASVAIEKEYPLHARRVMHGVWGAGQMSWTKNVFVVDGGVDVHDHRAVLRAMAERCDPTTDIERVRGPIDVLDHATPAMGAGTKLGFDCTARWPGEGVGEEPSVDQRFVTAESEAGGGLLRDVAAGEGVLGATMPADLPGWLLVRVDRDLGEPEREGLGRRVIGVVRAATERCAAAGGRPPAFVVVVGRGVELEGEESALFHWVANTDGGRDLQVWRAGSWAVAGFDATPKTAGDAREGQAVRRWPPALSMPAGVQERAEALLGTLEAGETSI